jgi:hypothetical protein
MTLFPRETVVANQRNSKADTAAITIQVPSAHTNDLARACAPCGIGAVTGQ